MVPLRQVAELVETTSPQIIKRQDLQRRIGIYANVRGTPVGRRRQRRAEDRVDDGRCRRATGSPSAGQQQDMQESFQAAVAALGLAVIFIYLILASQFASFTQPVAIMASLPFSLIGVFARAAASRGTTLNIFSIIGFIMLMGLVTKNAILLVDFANRGAARRRAASTTRCSDAGQVRLRPILMTTAAMIGGMLPLALGSGRGRRDAGADGPRDHRRRDHLDAPDARSSCRCSTPTSTDWAEKRRARRRGRRRAARAAARRAAAGHPTAAD